MLELGLPEREATRWRVWIESFPITLGLSRPRLLFRQTKISLGISRIGHDQFGFIIALVDLDQDFPLFEKRTLLKTRTDGDDASPNFGDQRAGGPGLDRTLGVQHNLIALTIHGTHHHFFGRRLELPPRSFLLEDNHVEGDTTRDREDDNREQDLQSSFHGKISFLRLVRRRSLRLGRGKDRCGFGYAG